MSMMLKTVNPEAAAVLEGDYPKAQIGLPVLYTMRPGQRRANRTDVPGFIMKQNEDGTCDLLLMMEPEDFVEERFVPQKSDHQINHCWDYIIPKPVLVEIEHLLARVELLEETRDRLAEAMFGGFETPPKAMMDYLADFDVRLKKLEKATKKG